MNKLHKHPQMIAEFPRLTHINHKVTSPQDQAYNCVAYGFDDITRRWWPDQLGTRYWPPGFARQETIPVFEAVIVSMGYQPTTTRVWESGFEKIALYCSGANPKHIAKMLPGGKWWSSKLGDFVDIQHTLDALEGPQYGSVHSVYRRPIP